MFESGFLPSAIKSLSLLTKEPGFELPVRFPGVCGAFRLVRVAGGYRERLQRQPYPRVCPHFLCRPFWRYLAALPGAEVDVTLEVHVRVPQGVEDDVVRVVSENAAALKFDHASFEGD
jgi:hypothetical protein